MLVVLVYVDDLTISPLKQHGESMEALKSKLRGGMRNDGLGGVALFVALLWSLQEMKLRGPSP